MDGQATSTTACDPQEFQMPTISTKDYLLDQAKRRLKPTPITIPGMDLAEKRLRKHEWRQFPLAEPPAGSDLKPAMGDSGLPIFGDGAGTRRHPGRLLQPQQGVLTASLGPGHRAILRSRPDAARFRRAHVPPPDHAGSIYPHPALRLCRAHRLGGQPG